jgi:hypothetical protein
MAIEKLTTGNEPPWVWYQLMKLREASEALVAYAGRRCALVVPSALAAIAFERPNDYLPVWEVHGSD